MTAQKGNSAVQERDPDLVNAEVAFKRAVRKVIDRAEREGKSLVFVKEGKIVEEVPK